MIGQNVPLLILGKSQGTVIRRNIITAVSIVMNFRMDHAVKGIHVNMHMVFLSPGCILVDTEQRFAIMELNAQEKFASLLTNPRSYAC